MSAEITELREYERLTGVIEKGLSNFIEVGKAMLELRDRKLYKAGGYSTFEECMEDLFGVSRVMAHHTMKASGLAEKMLTIVNISIPNEGTARELLTIKDEQLQLEVAKRALELAKSANLTSINSALIKEAKAEIIGTPVKSKSVAVKAEIVSDPGVDSTRIDQIRGIAGHEETLQSIAKQMGVDIETASPDKLLLVVFEAYTAKYLSDAASKSKRKSSSKVKE